MIYWTIAKAMDTNNIMAKTTTPRFQYTSMQLPQWKRVVVAIDILNKSMDTNSIMAKTTIPGFQYTIMQLPQWKRVVVANDILNYSLIYGYKQHNGKDNYPRLSVYNQATAPMEEGSCSK
jgi:hypothetical protein